jgi:hypothetical protein
MKVAQRAFDSWAVVRQPLIQESDVNTLEENRKLSDEQIKAAVDWWMAALRKPKFDTGTTRGKDPSTPQTEMMATLINAENKPIEDSITKFGHFLSEYLHSLKIGDWFNGLFVDYGPDNALFEAAEKAGIDAGNQSTFPWKTKMWFSNGGVQVACGYAAEQQEICK